ncbi:MAG: ribosomal protein S18-alanine N-acetyltransferase [Deltaproteobacteria bacterium]|nr:ribosomal protein S18-alanine N-acetyltransferase [Deltaproteobacteria bacterium]
MPSKLRIRQMELNDIQAIRDIEDRSFSLPYSAGIWEREKRNSISRTLVVVDDRGEGTAELWGYLNFWLILDEAEIHRIAVKEEYRRSGVAGRLLHEMFKVLRDMGIVSVHLEVRQSNHDAIKLYEKFGFMIKGRRKGYYQETGEDALILEADVKRITQAR